MVQRCAAQSYVEDVGKMTLLAVKIMSVALLCPPSLSHCSHSLAFRFPSLQTQHGRERVGFLRLTYSVPEDATPRIPAS